MLNPDAEKVMEAARPHGWVLEPEALRILAGAGVPVPRFAWTRSKAQTLEAAAAIGYPVVAKVVSPQIMHKSDVGGVKPGIPEASVLAEVYDRFMVLFYFN